MTDAKKTCPHNNNEIYKSINVQANLGWQSTKIQIGQTLTYTLTYEFGLWTALPSSNNNKLYDANGCEGLIVAGDQTGYPLPGANMGALVGKIGESGTPFLIGDGPLSLSPALKNNPNSTLLPIESHESGELFLCINDDISGVYGAGLEDNIGSVSILIHQYTALPVPQNSASEIALINTLNNEDWTKKQALFELTTHLQTAVEIELATIPVYLYTYYSINRTPDEFPTTVLSRFADEAGAVIMSVAVEEMLHLSLASNMLFSLGVQPELYQKSPSPYPTNLPGHKRSEPSSPSTPMSIPLAKLSVAQLTEFLEIECPAEADAKPQGDGWDTIGQVYSYIRCLIQSDHISDDDFKNSPHQIQSENYSPNSIDTAYPNAEFKKKCPVPSGQEGSASKVAQYGSNEDSHAGNAALITIDSKQAALQAIATIDAQGEGFDHTKYADESHAELSHYYRFLKLQSKLEGYDASGKGFPTSPKWPEAPSIQYSEADLEKIVFNFPDNPYASSYPAGGMRDVANLVSGLYQYMLIMTESIFLQDPSEQKVYFNQSLHRSMIWILDKIIQQMRVLNLHSSDNSMQSLRFAPTFENINLGPRYQAFATLKSMSQGVNHSYKNEGWYTEGLQYYVNMIEELPDVSNLWLTLQNNEPQTAAGCDVDKYHGVQKFPSTPPETLQVGEDRHACMGLNSCKNQGRTQQNNCAGQGYCSTALKYNFSDPSKPTVTDHTCHVKNDCSGQGGCGLYGTALEQNRPGANDCKTLGSCATPMNAERFSTDGPNRGESVWQRAREVFQQTKWAELQQTDPKFTGADFPAVTGTQTHPDLFKYGPTIEWIEDFSDEGMTACGSSGMSGAGSCS